MFLFIYVRSLLYWGLFTYMCLYAMWFFYCTFLSLFLCIANILYLYRYRYVLYSMYQTYRYTSIHIFLPANTNLLFHMHIYIYKFRCILSSISSMYIYRIYPDMRYNNAVLLYTYTYNLYRLLLYSVATKSVL